MRKKITARAALGAPIGVAIGHLITIAVSLFWGGGGYAPCVPSLCAALGGELPAVAAQAALCAVLGAVIGAASLIWEIERWSITRQTAVYFLVLSLAMLPTAYLLHWMEHSLKGVLAYSAVYLLIFVLIWLSQYLAARHSVRRMNERLTGRGAPGGKSK